MALAPETVKTIVTNSVTGTAGIVGTTVPSVQLSSVRAELAEEKNKISVGETEDQKKIQEVAENVLKYLYGYHYDTIGKKYTGQGAKPGFDAFRNELTLAYYSIKNYNEGNREESKWKKEDVEAFLAKLPKMDSFSVG